MKKLQTIIMSLMFVFSSSASAGIYADDLSRCLVESSTEDDKIKFVKWMFTAMALHPAVKDLAKIEAGQRDTANKGMAEIMMQLISVRCLDQSKKALQYEGNIAIQSSFQLFGQIAGQELFSNPQVAGGLSGLQKHFDTKVLNQRLGVTK